MATSSRAILTDFLRGKMGFDGICIADAVEMRGFQKNGPIPEVVVDGETGLLVPVEDPIALAQGLREMLADADLRRRAGQAGRERVRQRFSIRTRARRIEALLIRLVNKKNMEVMGLSSHLLSQ